MAHQATERHPRSHSEAESARDTAPRFTSLSPSISINLPDADHHARPFAVKHMSAPASSYASPVRHHRRTPSRSKGVKETLDARSHYGSGDDDGPSVHRINQYIIKQEIGRGSFGAVHLAADQYGNEYAVKEFSKSRLRKRAQSNLLRKPNQGIRAGHLPAGLGFNSPLHRLSSSDKADQAATNNSLSLIKEEIAIMKKLNHNNLVSLIEVLDDPQEDSLYMVLELCKKGVVMKVGLDERAEPYEEEACRCWFRDMILGIEYLHAQGIIHRDIKPDNCLITEDDILKIVDFGVSEMFEKHTEMATAKSAGSPAFMPPELCVARHGQVSGKAADIWSMGVTLYCLRYGHIPFEKTGMLELYESIRKDDVPLDKERDDNFRDLMVRLLEKDPEKRITMEQLREHPWVTKNGTDLLLSAEENCSDIVDPPTEAEMDNAITGNMAHLLIVMKAVRRFKDLLTRKRPPVTEGLFGRESRLVAPPHSIRGESRSVDNHDRRPIDKILVTAGINREIPVGEDLQRLPRDLDKFGVRSPEGFDVEDAAALKEGETDAHYKQRLEAEHHRPGVDPDFHPTNVGNRGRTLTTDDYAKGHAHDPLLDTLFLDVGADPEHGEGGEYDPSHPIVSESPPGVDENIYEQAYRKEMQRILEQRGQSASIYLTRRVEHQDDIRSHSNVLDSSKNVVQGLASRFGGAVLKSDTHRTGLAALVKQAQEAQQLAEPKPKDVEEGSHRVLLDRTGDTARKMKEMVDAARAAANEETLPASQGAMPGMPGGFPETPRTEER